MALILKMKFLSYKTIIHLLVLLAFLCCSCVNCTKKSSNGGDEDNKPKVNIEATTFATETFTGAGVSGQVTYEYRGDSITVNTGEKATIAEIEQGTTAFVKIIVEADDHVKRIIKQEPMTGTHEYTIDIKDKTGFDWDGFVNTMIPSYNYNILKRLRPPADGRLTMYFNPDYSGTGKRLPDSWIDKTIDEWNWIKNNSNGKITSIEYIRDGNKEASDPVGNGEIYVYYDSQLSGVANATWTNSDGSVYGIKLLFNSDIGTIHLVGHECRDSLVAGEQDGLGNRDDWCRFIWYRIAGNNNGSRIYLDREEQDIVDEYCGTALYLGQRIITKPILGVANPLNIINPFHNPDNDYEETFHPAKPVEREPRNKTLGTEKGTEKIKR